MLSVGDPVELEFVCWNEDESVNSCQPSHHSSKFYRLRILLIGAATGTGCEFEYLFFDSA